jgi:hypothetical protein
MFESQSLDKKVGVESKVSHGLGRSFLNLLWRKKWHVELLVVFKAVGLFPSFDLLALYSTSHPNMTFSTVLVFFELFFIELCDLKWPIRPIYYLPNTSVNTNVSNITLSHLITVVGISFVFGCMLINSSIKVLNWSISGSWAWLRHKCISETS